MNSAKMMKKLQSVQIRPSYSGGVNVSSVKPERIVSDVASQGVKITAPLPKRDVKKIQSLLSSLDKKVAANPNNVELRMYVDSLKNAIASQCPQAL